jgi:hypothetical protein
MAAIVNVPATFAESGGGEIGLFLVDARLGAIRRLCGLAMRLFTY